MPDKIPSVREHADKVIDQMVADGKIVPDAAAARAATGIPTFSKGTAALDPNTGKPIVPKISQPEFDAGKVSVEPSDEKKEQLPDAQPAVGAAPSSPPVSRTNEGVAPAAAPAQSQAQADAGAAAADAAAQQIIDEFAEFEEIEVDDPDLDLKYPVRVPKKYATSAKRGYPRRSYMDRVGAYLKNAEPVVKHLIENGQLNRILPLLQHALQDPNYGEYVYQGYQRSLRGEPLIEQAKREAAGAAAAAAAQQAPPTDSMIEDPYIAEHLRPVLERYDTLEQRLRQYEEAQRTQQREQTEAAQLARANAEQMRLAHMDLARMYPQEFSGDLNRDVQGWQHIIAIARDGDYAGQYGIRAGLIFAAQQRAQIEQERLAATASPTATQLAQVEAKQLALATQQAAAAARTVGGGAPSGAPAPPPVLQPPSTRRADGTIKPSSEYIPEMQAFIAATQHQRAS